LQQGAAVIDGSMDDITPVETWKRVMRQYKMAQRCQEELERLDSEEAGT